MLPISKFSQRSGVLLLICIHTVTSLDLQWHVLSVECFTFLGVLWRVSSGKEFGVGLTSIKWSTFSVGALVTRYLGVLGTGEGDLVLSKRFLIFLNKSARVRNFFFLFERGAGLVNQRETTPVVTLASALKDSNILSRFSSTVFMVKNLEGKESRLY